MTSRFSPDQLRGVAAAFLAPLFLGVAPIFGKLAIHAGADSFTVAAFRTIVAVVLLWAVYLLFFRKYIYIYPAGLLGCVVIGMVNGIGSLFYYGGLGTSMDASLAQLLNGLYLVFAVVLSHLDGQRMNRRVALRVGIALAALMMLTSAGSKPVDWLGVGLMLANALMFATTLILSQYVLYEMPSPTATLYILSTMAVVVVMVWAAVGQRPASIDTLQKALPPILILGVTTALSRLALFSGIKVLGGLQTTVFAIGEIGVALTLGFLVLGDRLTMIQLVGVGVLALSILLIRTTDLRRHGINPNALLIHDMAGVQFQRIAFHRAFGTHEQDNEYGIMAQITTSEMQAIRHMMGAKDGPVNPFPINRGNGNTPTPDEMLKYLDANEATRPKRPGPIPNKADTKPSKSKEEDTKPSPEKPAEKPDNADTP